MFLVHLEIKEQENGLRKFRDKGFIEYGKTGRMLI